jgi:hypothetical protein
MRAVILETVSLVAVLVSFLPSGAARGEPKANPSVEAERKQTARDRVETLIGLLASKNRVEMKDHRTDVPAGYRMGDQVVVFLAIQQLLQEGDVGIDVIVQHLNLTVYFRFGVVSSVGASVCVFSNNRSGFVLVAG